MAGKFYTIGHSVNTAEKVLQLLKDNKATILVDVRSMPYSRHSPQFNKESFSKNLADAGIQYQWEKDAFGARQEDASLYHKNGYLDFAKMRARPIFKQKVAEYSKKVEQGENVVFMCSEKNPIDCHRAILVARGFALEGLPVEHILPDGKLMSQEELDNKLLDLSPNHKLLKYINKAINQLNKIKILIKSQNQTKQNLNIIKTKTKESSPSRNIRIDLSKIGNP